MRRLGVAIAMWGWVAFAPGVAAQGAHDALIAKHAAANAVPESLVRRVIHIESRGNPRAVSKGNYGLMQIRLGTARAMGYRGNAQGLLDADTNMTYAVKYLAGAYRAAGCNESGAIRNYQRGYHGKRGAKCKAEPLPTQVVERRMHTTGAAASATASSDVLRPRVVQTVTITNGRTEPTRAPATLRRALPPIVAPPLPSARPQPVAAPSSPAPSPVPSEPVSTKVAAVEPVAVPAPQAMSTAPSVETTALPEPAAVPLPPARQAALAPSPEARSKSAQRSPTKRTRARKKQAEPENRVLAFIKGLVTPEKKSKSRKRRATR